MPYELAKKAVKSCFISGILSPAFGLVHRLAYNGDVVAFKMGRQQGGVGEASRFASSRRAKRGRFAYITQPPAHFQRNPPGRGQLAVFPPRRNLRRRPHYMRDGALDIHVNLVALQDHGESFHGFGCRQ